MRELLVPSHPNGVSHNGNGTARNGTAPNGQAARPHARKTPAANGIVEISGSSDATIAEAVREALSTAARTLRTLDGAGVRVIPQIAPNSGAPRFRVTLRITAPTDSPPAPGS
jgi:flavin-binding protein dodecin